MDFGFPQRSSSSMRSNNNEFKEGFVDEISDGFGRKLPFRDSVAKPDGLGSAESQLPTLTRPSFGAGGGGMVRTRRTNDLA